MQYDEDDAASDEHIVVNEVAFGFISKFRVNVNLLLGVQFVQIFIFYCE